MSREYDKVVNIQEGPMTSVAFPNGIEDTKDVLRREIITTRVVDGYLTEEKVVRDYNAFGDYNDVTTIRRIVDVKNV